MIVACQINILYPMMQVYEHLRLGIVSLNTSNLGFLILRLIVNLLQTQHRYK